MAFVVTYKGSVVAGPFVVEYKAREEMFARARAGNLPLRDFKVEHC